MCNIFTGKSCMTILTMVNYEWFEEWEDTTVRKRGEDYVNYKMRFANNLFAWACTLFPKIKDKVGFSVMNVCTYDSVGESTLGWQNHNHSLLFWLVSQLIFQDVATPLSNSHYLGAQRGAMYSAEHNLARFKAEAVARNRSDTPVKNLFMSGRSLTPYKGFYCEKLIEKSRDCLYNFVVKLVVNSSSNT